jgi:hypothetical protein
MKIHVLKKIFHDRLGRLLPGDIVDMNDKQAETYLKNGAVERYQTKVIRQEPFTDAGVVEQSSALPADQALPKTTSKRSRSGGSRKKTPPSSS